MNYESMSDFEINKAVAISVGFQCYYGDGSYTNNLGLRGAIVKGKNDSGLFMVGEFNPCNNPADAWRIISDNRISLIYDQSTEKGEEAQWCLASSPCDQHIVYYISPSKILRAAMIVFLEMQEAKK